MTNTANDVPVTGIERAKQRRAARDASGEVYVDGSIYDGMAACLVRSGKTIAHVVEYGDAVAIVAALASAPAESAAVAFARRVANMVGDELDAHGSTELRDAARAVIASAPACAASPDHAEIMETIANAGADWQKRGYATALAEVRDMANVGRSLLERIADHSREGPLKGWHPADCPTEVVCDLLNMLADASAPAGDGVEEGEPAPWAVAAERAACDAYAQHMGLPEESDPTAGQRAAAIEIERHALAALASAPAELAFLRQFYRDWHEGKADSHLRDAADAFEDDGGVIVEPTCVLAAVRDGNRSDGVEAAVEYLMQTRRIGTASCNDDQRDADDAKMREAYRDILNKAAPLLASAPAGDGVEFAARVLWADGQTRLRQSVGDLPRTRTDFRDRARKLLAEHPALACPHSAVAPAGDGVEAVSGNHPVPGHDSGCGVHDNYWCDCSVRQALIERVDIAIDYCNRRLADRFGNAIRATLRDCAAALARPRAAVGERERAAMQRVQAFADGAGLFAVYGPEWCLLPERQFRADLAAILALQSPPAKVER